MQIDQGGVAWNFKDPSTHTTLAQMQKEMRNTYLQLSNNDLNATADVQKRVAANPGLVPLNPFAEKYFANAKNLYFPGSASANFLYLIMDNGMSDTDTLSQADRLTKVNGKSFPNCISATG